jgi:hypothetical protein
MKPPTSTPLVIAAIMGVFLAFLMGFSCAKLRGYKFYDGEGNTVPYRAVDSLVHSRFMDKDFSKAGRDTLSKYFPHDKWQSFILSYDGQNYTALIIEDSTNQYFFIKPVEGRFHSNDGDTSLFQVMNYPEPLYVSTKDSAQMAIDRWNKIFTNPIKQTK